MKDRRILIIEDNHDVRENLAEILDLAGYVTAEAENGKIGISKAKESPPDLILCDVMMPELDGFGVLKIINQHPTLMHIPFMFLTAKSEKDDFRKGMGLGADDYIVKPFDDVELLSAIEIRLKKSESQGNRKEPENEIKQFYDISKGAEDLLELTKNRENRRFNKKDIVYEVQQFPRWIYFVKSGQIKTYQINEFGKELITHLYSKGDFFGYLPIMQNSKYRETSMAMEDAEVLLIPPEDFKMLLFNNRDVSANFIQLLAIHIDDNEKQLIDLAYSSVRRKVANALLILDRNTHRGVIEVMRDDLAAIAGTAKETTVRTLSDFKSEKIVKIEDNQIHILDKKALESMPQ